MGQYYYPTILREKNKRFYSEEFYSHDYDNGLKLTEHSYCGNHFVETIMAQLLNKPGRLAWLGDYHNDGDFAELNEDLPKIIAKKFDEHYKCFDTMPFAFTDIEMVFDEERHAVDWIFRYGNQALANLEKYPLEQLIGTSFGSIFANMDNKWLRSYERSVLYGEILEIVDFSPEIDAYLKVISFPTFPGHCGCILFDVSKNVNDMSIYHDILSIRHN